MRLIKIDVTLDRVRLIFNRGLPYNARKVAHSNELSLKSDGRNGYKMRLFNGWVNKIAKQENDCFSEIRLSVWCKESEANEWEEKLLKALHREIADRMNDLSHLLSVLHK